MVDLECNIVGTEMKVHMTIMFFSLVLLVKSIGATVIQGPDSITREANQLAEFTCTVACSHSIDWYVEGYRGDISETCSGTIGEMMACRVVTQTCSSSTSTSGYRETLRIFANSGLAGSSIALQCAAVSLSAPSPNNCPPFLAYSRFALLTVSSLHTESPPPVPSPSPSPVVCPSTTQGVPKITETVTEVKTVVQTVIVTVTPEPHAINRGHSHRGYLGKVLMELLSWVVTFLVGVLVIM